MEPDLTTQEKKLLSDILLFEKKERDELFEECLADIGITGFKAKATVKFLIPMLQKALAGLLTKGAERFHAWLQIHSQSYDQFVTFLARRLLLKVQHKFKTNQAIKERLPDIEGITVEDLDVLSDQEKIWFAILSQLNLLVLGMSEVKANPLLRLESPKKYDASRPSRLLRPHNDFIPLIGRDKELGNLQEFCLGEASFSWMVMIGDGGIGKTRLAQHFAKQMGNDGWNAGFLNEFDLESLVSCCAFSCWQPVTDTLIVIDYAASKADNLRKFIHRAALLEENCECDPQESSARLRLLLLERHADESSGWLHGLLYADEGGLRDDIHDAFHPVIKLNPPMQTGMDARTSMLQIFRETLRGYAELSNTPALPVPEFAEFHLRMLFTSTEGKPFYVQIAGLHYCECPDVSRLTSWGKNDLLSYAVEREESYIEKLCKFDWPKGLCPEMLCRTVALHFLARPEEATDSCWLRFVKEEWSALGYDQCEPARVSDFLIAFLGEGSIGKPARISPISPDLIGAYFLYRQLTKKHLHSKCHKSLKRVLKNSGFKGWDQLLLAVRDLHGIPGCQDAVQWLPPLLEGLAKDDFMNISDRIPTPSVALADFSVEVNSRLFHCLSETNDNEALLALCLNKLANCYSTVGRRQEAVTPAERAVEIRERLAQQNPVAYAPALAASLHTLGNRYSDVGRQQDAVAPAEWAVEIRDRLAKQNPDIYESELAASLNNLGNLYFIIGKRQEAMTTAGRTVDIYKRLAEQNSAAFEPDYAMSLNNLASIYSALGKGQEALPHAEQSVEIRTRLAQQNPDAYEPYLASSQHNLGILYSAVGKRHDAVAAAERAMEIYARLAQQNPDAYEPNLATSLLSLGNFYSGVGRRQEAVTATEGAVEIGERLVEQNPDAFEPFLAMSLNNLGNRYSQVGRQQEALLPSERAIDIYERLAQQNPDAYEPDLAMSLHNLAVRNSEVGRRQAAVAPAERAVEIRERLAQQNPDAYEPDLAKSLHGLGERYSGVGRRWESVAPAERAVKICERLAKQAPDAYEPNLANCLCVIGSIYRKVRRYQDASNSFKRGIQTLQRLFFAVPEAFSQQMVSLLSGYGRVCRLNNTAPDENLLKPILQILKQLEDKVDKR